MTEHAFKFAVGTQELQIDVYYSVDNQSIKSRFCLSSHLLYLPKVYFVPMPVPGPQLPPSLLTKRKREDSEDREGQQKEPSTPDPVKNVELDDSSSTKKSRAIGPTLPPANLDQLPSKQPEDGSSSGDDDDNDDDDFGPSLPRGPQESPAMNSSSTRPEPPVAVERDSWMTVPPSQSDWTARVDPTKLRNRKFNTGKGAKGPSPATERGISVKWTETPAEKKARLEREMMGIQEAGQPAENRQDKLKDEAAAKRIREYSVS